MVKSCNPGGVGRCRYIACKHLFFQVWSMHMCLTSFLPKPMKWRREPWHTEGARGPPLPPALFTQSSCDLSHCSFLQHGEFWVQSTLVHLCISHIVSVCFINAFEQCAWINGSVSPQHIPFHSEVGEVWGAPCGSLSLNSPFSPQDAGSLCPPSFKWLCVSGPVSSGHPARPCFSDCRWQGWASGWPRCRRQRPPCPAPWTPQLLAGHTWQR